MGSLPIWFLFQCLDLSAVKDEARASKQEKACAAAALHGAAWAGLNTGIKREGSHMGMRDSLLPWGLQADGLSPEPG